MSNAALEAPQSHTEQTKPPTQVAAVQGIAPKPVTMNDPEPAGIDDWVKLINLPPFQMFLVEKGYLYPFSVKDLASSVSNGSVLDSLDKIMTVAKKPRKKLYREYYEWHQEKGYWPNETPMGEVMGDNQ